MVEKYRRRNYFIDKQFQSKFILKFCGVVVVSSVIIGAVIFFMSRGSTTVAIENTHVIVKKTADFILPVIINTLVLTAMFSALAVAIMSLLVSHKISGPLYRLKREIDKVKEGDLGRNFNIRSDDQLQVLAESLNEMTISLRGKYVRLKDECGDLANYLEKNSFSVPENEKNSLKQKLENINNSLNSFKVQLKNGAYYGTGVRYTNP